MDTKVWLFTALQLANVLQDYQCTSTDNDVCNSFADLTGPQSPLFAIESANVGNGVFLFNESIFPQFKNVMDSQPAFHPAAYDEVIQFLTSQAAQSAGLFSVLPT